MRGKAGTMTVGKMVRTIVRARPWPSLWLPRTTLLRGTASYGLCAGSWSWLPGSWGAAIAEEGQVASSDMPLSAADRARALFSDLIEGRWEETSRQFVENMRVRADADCLARGWTRAAGSVGGFVRMGEPVVHVEAPGGGRQLVRRDIMRTRDGRAGRRRRG
jgi:hypothetical protein